MAKKLLTALDLSKNEIQNAVLQVLASAPGTPVAGQVYYNSTSGRMEFRGAAAWIDPTARANHSGTQTASTISDFVTAVQTVRLDQLAAPTAAVSLNAQKLTNVADGTVATDAATLGQVQNLLNGTDWKNSVRCATTANITLSGLQAIDGVAVVANDRVLVKNQTTGSQNGFYLAASGAWTRTTDADGAGEVTPAATVMVEEGTTLAGTQWRVSNTGTITIGTTAITFAQIGAGTSYTQGTGISIAGNVIAVDTAVVARKFSATIGDGTSTSIQVTHNLGTQDVHTSIRDASTNAFVDCDITSTSTNITTFAFTTAPAANAYRVTIVG